MNYRIEERNGLWHGEIWHGSSLTGEWIEVVVASADKEKVERNVELHKKMFKRLEQELA